MSKLSRMLLAIGSLLLVGVLWAPIWRIHLIAPQYPEGLGMEIRANRVHGHEEHDLENINELNHYIGMKRIETEEIPVLRVMPWVIGGLAVFGGVAALVGRRRLAWAWLVTFGASGVVGLGAFWWWEYDYGHHLDLEHAIIKVPGMTYQPPIIGEKQLLNFTAASWPAVGAILAATAFVLGAVAVYLGRRRVARTAFLLLVTGAGVIRAQQIDVGPGRTVHSITEAVALARPGSRIVIRAGTYREPTIVIDKAVEIVGEGRPVLDGEGQRGLLLVTADDVTVRGLVLRNVGSSFVEDRAAIRVTQARGCVIEDNRVENGFFGIYLSNASDCRIERNTLRANATTETTSGNGIHLWSSRRITISNNDISGHRDGIYFEFVHNSVVDHNRSEGNNRYGLHFMYSDDCRYLDNLFRHNGSGVAVMFTKRMEMVSNRFEDNWGAAAYGLLLKEITDSRLTGNIFRRNTTALLADGASRLVAEDNEFVGNGWAVKLDANTQDARFERNEFMGNTFDVASNSREQSTTFAGNYWDEYRGYDLNHDGVGDVPHRPVRLFSMLVAQNQPALILLRSAFVSLLDAAERVLPALTPETLADARPAMKPRRLP